MKLIWHSNSPFAPTGYGVQTALTIPRLQALGHDVICSGFYGVQGSPLHHADALILPTSKEPYGNDVLADDFAFWQADATITLIDAWIFNPSVTAQLRWVPYFPVDCDPLPPLVATALRPAFRRIAYAKFGLEKAKEAGFGDTLYVPHMVDTAFFKPMDKHEARKSLGMPDDRQDWFLVGIVAANKGNPSRKCFDQQIRAFAEFHKAQPKSMLCLHTDVWGGYDGENIPRLLDLAGLTPDAVAFPNKYQFLRGMLTQDYLRLFYNAMDVLSNVTRGEGFGVPIIEAMSCKTPAIVTDATAMPELVDAGAGWKVPVSERFFYQDSYQFLPSVPGIVDAYGKAFDARNDQALKDKARAGVVAEYDAAVVTERYWKPVLAGIEADIQALKAKQAARQAQRLALQAKTAIPQNTTDSAKIIPTEIVGIQKAESVVVAVGENGKDEGLR